MDLKISVGGLSELSRGLKTVDVDAPKELRIALNSAADILVDHAQRLIPTDTGAARRSLVARSSRTAARVAVGGRRAPYYPWLDFGGQGRIRGRPAPREFIREGRYIYPTLRKIRPLIERQLKDAIATVIRNAGMRAD